MGLILGLDIGIASVGYGVIDSENKLIKSAGVRLFESANPENNKIRREMRSGRRNRNRRNYRIESMEELLESRGMIANEDKINPYYLRCKGLSEKLKKDEIANAMLHIAKRRGISYVVDLSEEDNQEDVAKNEILTAEKHPCEIQLERLKKFGRVRGNIETEEGALSNTFTNDAYVREVKVILNNQKNYYPEIDEEFISEVIEIITRKRPYYIGPGDEMNRTNYGIYRVNGETWNNLFEHLIGNCSIYTDEKRAPASSYTAQEFNFLNDLNNIKADGLKLSEVKKREILEKVLSSKTVKMMNLISKATGVEKELIKGYRIDRKQKPEFHTFELERKMRREFEDSDFDYENLSIEDKDKLAYILSVSYDMDSLKKQIKNSDFDIDFEIMERLLEFRKKNSSFYSKWHSFSLKLMYEIRDDLFKESKNQMEILTEKGIKNDAAMNFDNYKYIPENLVTENIYNPVVAKSARETIKVINALLKEYGEFEAIIIEMPRDSNEAEPKKNIQKRQRKNEKEKKELISISGVTEKELMEQKNLLTKLRLWKQQDEQCIYSGKKISAQDIVKNPNKYEIDHIIPLSVSLDDSLNNKVLVLSTCNQRKGNRTPFRYLISGDGEIGYEEYKNIVTKLFSDKKISMSKRNLLLMEEDISKYDVRRSFIERNLNDTRYSSRLILNSLQNFMKQKDIDTNIHVINGKFTSQLRRKWGIIKDRDESFAHHAIDAMVIAGSYMIGQSKATVRNPFLKQLDRDKLWDIKTNREYNKEVYRQPWDGFNIDIQSSEDIKYSHKVDSKVNRKISKETIYSTRKYDSGEYVISKYKNIYDKETASKLLEKMEKDKNKGIDECEILMKKHDPQTYELLESIVEEYSDSKNPFAAYKEEHGYIRKYSKKNNGPIIKDIKYTDGKLGNYIELKKGIPSKNKRVVKLSLNPFRSDVYYNKEKNAYIFLGLKYSDFKIKNGNYTLDMNLYEIKKKEEGIDESYKFVFTVYKNSLVGLEYNDGKGETIYRFLSKGNSSIELKPIDRSGGKRIFKGTKRNVKKIKKYSSDILGNIYCISSDEKLITTYRNIDHINNI